MSQHPPPMPSHLVSALVVAAVVGVFGAVAWALGRYFVMVAGQFGQ